MGIYLHIPFCKKACHYCNFHFSTSLKQKDALLKALLRELELRQDYLPEAPLESVYLGGGTPSLLSVGELEQIFIQINRLFQLSPDAEITLEANPDDINPEVLADWRNYTPINRLSIGIQSFDEAELVWMNRAHHAHEARACMEQAQRAGFENLTVDLIYGSPLLSDAQWAENLRIVTAQGIPHLSCYCLTVEEGTALDHFVKKGKSQPVDEEKAARQLEFLMDYSAKAGFEQYEISNFAQPGYYARHNSSYWKGAPYLGIGPSAHSFNGSSRQWNIANNALYIRSLEKDLIPAELEVLTPEQRYNEYIMTGLRTSWGCSQEQIASYGPTFLNYFLARVQALVAQDMVEQQGQSFRLSPRGKLLADKIALDIFYI